MERLRNLLPAKLRDRSITYLALAALWPFVPASVSAAFFAVYENVRPGMLSVFQYFAMTGIGAVLSAAGSAIVLLTLPVRYATRIAIAVSGGLLVLLMYGLLQGVVIALFYYLNLL